MITRRMTFKALLASAAAFITGKNLQAQPPKYGKSPLESLRETISAAQLRFTIEERKAAVLDYFPTYHHTLIRALLEDLFVHGECAFYRKSYGELFHIPIETVHMHYDPLLGLRYVQTIQDRPRRLFSHHELFMGSPQSGLPFCDEPCETCTSPEQIAYWLSGATGFQVMRLVMATGYMKAFNA